MTDTHLPSEIPLTTKHPWVLCGCSRNQWYRLARSGLTPLPIRLGSRRPVYLISALEDWLKAGAPARQEVRASTCTASTVTYRAILPAARC